MKIKRLAIRFAIVGLMVGVLGPWATVSAASITNRSLTLGNSAATASTTYLFSFRPGTTGNVGAIKFEICTSPLAAVACTGPAGTNAAGASSLTLGGEIAGTTGFVIGSGTPPAPTADTVWITDPSPESLTVNVASTVRFSSIVNPNTTNQQFYARITTYTNSNGTGQVDFGAVAVSTAQQLTVSGTMPESLVFCVGTTWTTNCGDISGSTIDLGTFSPGATSFGTSVMAASTNAGFGYSITVNGTTLTSGANTITALASQTTSQTGLSQFGLNLRNNATPNVGTDVSGTGSGTHHANYGIIDQFRFVTGDIVATASGPTDQNLFTASYIVNVPGSQAAGLYTATMTYICTATF